MNIYDKIKAGYYSPEYHGIPFASFKEDREKATAYRSKSQMLHQEFKKDALEHVGLQNHLKADAIFNKAWEDGHAYGYYEVLNQLMELAELFD